MQARIDEKDSNWKFNHGDLSERLKWDDYQKAYEAALTKCNTEYAPWHIIPSDKKWYRNLTISELLSRKLKALDPQYPKVAEDLSGIVVE